MRGGVSLSVWIGGTCSELDALRQAAPRRRTGDDADATAFWRPLLELTGYDDVAIDIMAGASAGGLNAVIFAASQIYGFSIAELRRIWLDVGQLDAMVRQSDGPQPSLLLGDGFMLTQLQSNLARLIRETPAERRPAPPDRPRLDLFLTATLVEPVRRPVPSEADEPLDVARYTAGFHLLNLGAPGWLSDFTDDTERVTWRLALAGRSTSSFPAAFEAAAIFASRPRSFADEGRSLVAGERVDMRDVFTEARGTCPTDRNMPPPDENAFVVSDGGVLDNIPLGRALHAIAVAPADRRTSRFLVYVQPGAVSATTTAGVTPAEPSLDARRSTTSVLTGAVRTRVTEETIAGDLAALELHNRSVERGRRLRRLNLGQASDRAGLRDVASLGWASYRLGRAEAEAAAIRALLDDPVSLIGKDVFPLADPSVGRVRGGDDLRSPIAGWRRSDRVALDGALADALADDLPLAWADGRWTTLYGPGPLGRVTRLLLEWSRLLEARAADPEGTELAGECKGRLYRVLLVAELILERQAHFAWTVLAANRDPHLDVRGWALDAARRVQRLDLVPAALCDDLVRQLAQPGARFDDTGDADHVSRVRQHLLERLDGVCLPTALDDDGTPALTRLLVDQVLVPQAATLAGIPVDPRWQAVDHPAEPIHRVLTGSPPTPDDLAALEVLGRPEEVAGPAGRGPVEFVRLSAGGVTPVGGAFARLVPGAASTDPAVPDWMRPAVLGDPVEVPVDRKLAGNELKNFAAFLRPEWRANDWMWGRLDAVPTVVELLVTPSTIRGAVGVDGTEGVLTRIRELVVGTAETVTGDPATSWEVFRQQALWAPSEPAVRDELTAVVTGTGDTLSATRAVLAARRQWDVLAEERGGTPRSVVEQVAAWDVGLQTLTNPRQPGTMQLGRQLFGVGRSVAEWNLELTPARRVAKWITRPISRVGAFAARFLLGGWKDRALAVAAAALLVIGAVALVVTGFLSWPGRVALIAIVLGIAGIVWLSRPIRAKGASPPPSAA